MDDTFDLETRLAKINEQAEPETGRFEIIGALHPAPGSSVRGHVRVVQRFGGLRFDQQVWEVLTDHRVIVVYPDATLAYNRDAGST